MSKDKVVGFIGLGTMGGRMATNLQKDFVWMRAPDIYRFFKKC